MVTYDQLTEAVSYLRHAIGDVPDIAFILGSGLGHMADVIENPVYVDYGDIPHFPVSTVAGHRGRFVYGCIHGKKVLIMQGRVHYYEGYDMSQVVMPVRVIGLLGVDKLLLTNAAGGIFEKLEPGDIMMISDHISTFVPSPLICSYYNKLGVRFPDMTHVYDVELNSYIREAFAENDIDFRSGVYIQVTGPQYETPAEIRMFAGMGADAVGMSTVCEAIAARHMGMRVAGLSSICNKAAGLGGELSHEEIIAAGDEASGRLVRIIDSFIQKIWRSYMDVILYTDGSARGNPNGPGGYGAVLQFIDAKGQLHEREYSQGYIKTTNNRMELMAAIVGLEALIKPCNVKLYSDSQYLCNAFNQHWIEGWIKKGWKRGKNEPVKNRDLWERLLAAKAPHNVEFLWVKGHAGNPGNERCDMLATAAADGDGKITDEGLDQA